MLNIADKLPTTWRPWYLAARPRSLPATYAALLLGGAITIAHQRFDLVKFLLALIGALLLQAASNFINEYTDHQRGTDAHKVAGMGMVLASGQLTAQQVLIGAIVCVVSGALIGLLLVAYSGPLLLWIGMFGVLVVIIYTAGPLPLSHLGLGELAVFIAMGPLMVLGTYYAVSGTASWIPFLSGLTVAFTVAAILHANNMRDRDADQAANKKTLAVRLGVQGARTEYKLLMYGAYVMTMILVLAQVMPWPTLLIFATLPEAIHLVRQGTSTTDTAILHRVQGLTARLHWRIGLTLTAGWLIAWLLGQLFNR